MLKQNNLQSHFDETIAPKLEKLEKKRLLVIHTKTIFKQISMVLLAGLLFVLFKMLWMDEGSAEGLDRVVSFLWVMLFTTIPLIIVLTIVYKIIHLILTKGMQSEYTNIVNMQILNQYENFKYNKDDYIQETDFNKSELYRKEVYKYSGSDLLYLDHKDMTLSMSFVNAVSNTSNQNTSSQIYKGLFVVADFHTHFRGKSIILEQLVYEINSINDFELIHIKDTEFEKEFTVYSTDEVSSKKLISPFMIEQIKELKQKIKSAIRLSLIEGKLYISIQNSRDFFQLDYSQPLNRYPSIQSDITIIESIMDIIANLKQNERLWMGE